MPTDDRRLEGRISGDHRRTLAADCDSMVDDMGVSGAVSELDEDDDDDGRDDDDEDDDDDDEDDEEEDDDADDEAGFNAVSEKAMRDDSSKGQNLFE